MSENDIARRIMANLDATVVPKMKEKGKTVTEFVERLRSEIAVPRANMSPLKGASIIHGGSAYEGLAVSEDADFDIIIVPGKPYIAENFVAHREPNRFFTLEWKSQVYNKGVSDSEGYLDTARLRTQLFDELVMCVNAVRLANERIECKEGIAALNAEIFLNSGLKISIDIVPLITFHSWGQCPDLKPLHEMPLALREYIGTLNRNGSPTMFFSLAVVGKPKEPRLCNISFHLLEKKFVTSDIKVRNMARLVKFVAHRLEWGVKYSFQSFFPKRMVVKHYDSLKEMDLWNGYRAILQYIWQEFQSGTIDGYFVKNQVTYTSSSEYAVKLQMEINNTLTKSAREIASLM